MNYQTIFAIHQLIKKAVSITNNLSSLQLHISIA